MFVPKFTPEAMKEIKRLPKNVRNSLRKKIEKVVLKDPIGCSEALSGLLAQFRSFHLGDYRLVYRVFEEYKTVAFVGVGKKNPQHYADIYDRLESLIGAGKLAETFLNGLRAVEKL